MISRYAGVAAAAIAMAVGANVPAAAQSGGARTLDKKLIEYGWDVPFPDFVRDNIREMEKRPFDGLIFKLHGGRNVLQPKRWDEAQFRDDYEAVQAIRWERFTDNFVSMLAASDQDWFSDEHWEAIEHNVRLVAKAARLGRCVGVCFDPEPYGTNPWLHAQAAHRETKGFAEYEQMTRQRGAQFVRAILAELPDPKILTFFQISVLRSLLTPMAPEERGAKLAQQHYGLVPAFLNGMLDAGGDKVTIIDGNESAYYYTEQRQYFEAYHTMAQRALLLIDPALWHTYRTQVQAGQALYIDQYFGLRQGRKTYGHYMEPGDQAKWFEHNVYWALHTADEYVWCYSERMNWWTNENVPEGCEEAIRSARAKLDEGRALGIDLEPIIEGAHQRQRQEQTTRVTPQGREQSAWSRMIPGSPEADVSGTWVLR